MPGWMTTSPSDPEAGVGRAVGEQAGDADARGRSVEGRDRPRRHDPALRVDGHGCGGLVDEAEVDERFAVAREAGVGSAVVEIPGDGEPGDVRAPGVAEVAEAGGDDAAAGSDRHRRGAVLAAGEIGQDDAGAAEVRIECRMATRTPARCRCPRGRGTGRCPERSSYADAACPSRS